MHMSNSVVNNVDQ